MSEENRIQKLTPLTDSVTLSYLKGQITFQEYECLMENQQHANDNANAPYNTVIEEEIQITEGTSSSFDPTLGLKPLGNRKRISSNSSTNNNNKKIDSSIDRFLNLQNIISSNEDESDDENANKSANQTGSDNLDLYDDNTSNWNDFDIETLNFDNFIKSNKPSETDSTPTTSGKQSKKKDSIEQSSQNSQKRKRDDLDQNDIIEMKSKRRRNRVLPLEIQSLMGEANLAYARGETNKAIDICLEVIKYAPKASEPFQLLSLLYSETGANDKSLRVGLIAAQLNKDPDEWIQLIQQAVIEGDIELVLFCYNNAIQCNPKNIALHVDRIRILEEKNDQKRLILAKLMLLKYAEIETDFEVYDKYFNQVMSELNSESDRSKKIYVLKNDMKKMKEKFPLDRLKLLIKTLIEQKSYKDAINLMMTSCKITIKNQTQILPPPADILEPINDLEFDIPSACNNYIRAQFVVCLINLDYKKEESLIQVLYDQEVEQCASEFKLLADTYYAKKNYAQAKHFYHLLLTNVREFLVQLDMWLKYGNCCNSLNEIEDAINAYRNAVNLDSSNTEAALSLVNILKKNSSLFDEAANVIRNTLSHKKTHLLTKDFLNLKINQCFIQYEKSEYENYIQNARQLLFRYLEFVLEPKNISSLLRVDSKVQRAIVFHQILEENNYEMEFYFNKLNSETQNAIFEIYLKLCKVCVKLKLYDQLLIYSVGATVLPLVYERMDWNKSINFSCLIACILKNDGKNAFNILKDFVIEFKNSNKLWSYVGIVIGLYPSLNQQKFFIRLGAKFMDHLPLCLINAHFAIMSGTYRYALVEYMNCFKQNPYDPFINLIISITYCHISCQKYNTKRHLLVSQSLVFLRRYIKFRGLCQESYYNTARVLHQLSLFDLAAHYYKKCLETPCFFPEQEDIYNLKRYAAYNLISIYKHSGSVTLARQVMKNYLTI